MGGGRENEGENEMRWEGGREGDATAPVFRTAAGHRVSHDRSSSGGNSTEKMLLRCNSAGTK